MEPNSVPSRQQIMDDVRATAEAAIAEKIGGLNPDIFAKQMTQELTKYQQSVIWQLLGLENRWGKWEVDHCNGRASPITNYLSEETTPIVREWVNNAVQEVLKSDGEKLRSTVRDAVKHEFRKRTGSGDYDLRRLVISHVDQFVSTIVGEVMSELTE